MNFQLLNPLRWRKSFLALILGGFILIWFMFIDTYSIWTRIELMQQKAELKAKKEELKAETQVLKQKIENDPRNKKDERKSPRRKIRRGRRYNPDDDNNN